MKLDKILFDAVQAIQRNDVYLANQKISKALKIAPKNFNAVYFAGLISAMSKDYKQAILHFKKAIHLNPNISEVYFNLAKALSDIGQDDEACRYHKIFLQREPQNINGQINYGLSLIKLEQLNEAKQIFLSIKNNIDENNILALLNLGTIYLLEENYDEAILIYKKIINFEENVTDAWIGLGRSYTAKQNYEEAEKAFKRSIAIDPTNSQAIEYLGIFLIGIEKYNEALNLICNSIYFDRSSRFHELVGDIYFQLKNIDLAIDFYNKSIKIDKNNIHATNKLALRLCDKRNFKDAEILLSNIINIFPENFETLNNYSIILLGLKDYESAYSYAKKALNIKPTYHVYNNIGSIQKKLLNYTDAEKNFLNSVNLNPGYIDGYVNLGILYGEVGDVSSAEKYFHTAMRIDNKNANLNYNYSLFKLYYKNFEDGWYLYDYRWEVSPGLYNDCKYIKNKQPFNIDGNQRIIIIQEQGVGDLILYSSILTEFRNLQNISLALDSRLHSIYERSFPNFSLIDISLINNINLNATYVPIGSLGKNYRLTLDSFERVSFPYLKSNRDKIISFKKTISSDEKKLCGLSWRSYNEVFGDTKSLELNTLIKLLNNFENINFLNLQYDVSDSEIDFIKNNGINFEDFLNIDKKNDFESIFALVEICDFIITTSSTIAHIAGSLGKDTYLLLPKGEGKLWYWHTKNDSNVSLWYPSIRIFTQDSFGDWGEPIKRIRAILNNLQF